jgi:hypothetical protein
MRDLSSLRYQAGRVKGREWRSAQPQQLSSKWARLAVARSKRACVANTRPSYIYDMDTDTDSNSDSDSESDRIDDPYWNNDEKTSLRIVKYYAKRLNEMTIPDLSPSQLEQVL